METAICIIEKTPTAPPQENNQNTEAKNTETQEKQKENNKRTFASTGETNKMDLEQQKEETEHLMKEVISEKVKRAKLERYLWEAQESNNILLSLI